MRYLVRCKQLVLVENKVYSIEAESAGEALEKVRSDDPDVMIRCGKGCSSRETVQQEYDYQVESDT